MAINNFKNIRIFDDNGYELIIHKNYSVALHIYLKENKRLPFYINESAEFYILCSDDIENLEPEIYVKNGGKFRLTQNVNKAILQKIKQNKEENNSLQKIDEYFLDDPKNEISFSNLFYNSIDKVELVYNSNIQSHAITKEISKDIFELKFAINKLYQSKNDLEHSEYDVYDREFYIEEIQLKYNFEIELRNFLYGNSPDSDSDSVSKRMKIKNLYPYYTISGSYMQEPISTELVQANTFILLDECKDENNVICYKNPSYVSNNGKKYQIYFVADFSSEAKFIEISNNSNEIIWNRKCIIDLENDETKTFTIGFKGKDEGAYSNQIDAYIRVIDNAETKKETKNYYLGSLFIKSETISEDERYRTFFENFGIPDPKDYQKVFKQVDMEETKIDNDFLNEKSKELFLTYDQIFPFAGTYKALINAVRYLGYDDIIFKEWYKIYDINKEEPQYVLFDKINTNDNIVLESCFNKIGLTRRDVESFKKLKRLSIVYHINQWDKNTPKYDTQNLYYKDRPKERKGFDVPLATKCYEYGSDSMLAKLLALREWLQKYIVGLNVKITDVTGEGVYFLRYASNVYSTAYLTSSYQKEQAITPKHIINDIDDGAIKNSQAVIRCSLHEFHSMKFKDFETCKINDYIKGIISIDQDFSDIKFVSNKKYIENWKPNIEHAISSQIPISTTLDAPLGIDYITYNLENMCDSGSLFEYTDNGYNPIIIKDNRITIFDDTNESIISNDDENNIKKCPIIYVKCANIRQSYGDWDDNVLITIKSVTDSNGNMYYRASNINTKVLDSSYIFDTEIIDTSLANTIKYYNGDKNILVDRNTSFTSNYTFVLRPQKNAKLIYTDKNKYHVPLLFIQGYSLDTGTYPIKEHMLYFDMDPNKQYIIEIMEGSLNFNNISDLDSIYKSKLNIDNENYISCKNQQLTASVQFSFNNNEVNTRKDQNIYLTYNYRTKKTPLFEYNLNEFKKTISSFMEEMINDRYAFDQNINKNLRKIYIEEYIRDRFSRLMPHEYDFLKKCEVYKDDIKEPIFDTAGNYQIGYHTDEDSTISLIDINSFTRDIDKEIYKFILNRNNVDEYVKHRIAEDVKNNKSLYYQKYRGFIKNLAKVNKFTDVVVNRLGNYTLSAIGYDGYNNMYSNKTNIPVHVSGKPLSIDCYVNSQNSNNDIDFFNKNINGELVEDINTLIFDEDIRYPKTYRNYNIKNEKNILTYSSYTYYNSIPKISDTIHVNNLTEIVSKLELCECDTEIQDTSCLRLEMLDENLDKQNLYFSGCNIKLILYNNNMLQIEKSFEPIIVKSSLLGVLNTPETKNSATRKPAYYKIPSLKDNNYENDSYIYADFNPKYKINSEEIAEINSRISSGECTLYAINTTELYDFNFENLEDVYNSSGDVFSCLITNDEETGFGEVHVMNRNLTNIWNIGDVIKIGYVYDSTSNNSILKYRNEVAYRITAKKLYCDINHVAYVLNDAVNETDIFNNSNLIINRYKILNNEKPIYAKVSLANLDGVDYILDIAKNGEEFIEHKNTWHKYNETLETKTKVKYDNTIWFASDYIDNTYSLYQTEYNPKDLIEIWWDNDNNKDNWGSNVDVYKFRNYPITLEQDRKVLITSSNNDKSVLNNYYTVNWTWQIQYNNNVYDYFDIAKAELDFANQYTNYDLSEIFEDNVELQKSSVLFKSLNKNLSLYTKFPGINVINLEVVDIFGNILRSTSKINVKGSR